MTANARNTKRAPSRLPTLDDVANDRVTLDEYEIAHGEDIPEWTEADLAAARPISDFPELQAALEAGRRKSPTAEEPIPVHVSPPTRVRFEGRYLLIDLEDGRELKVRITWYPDLVEASPQQRSAYVLTPNSVRWPEFDEEAKIADILRTQLKLAALERARGQRGPQKTPTKERVALRLDRNIVDHFRHDGPGWQTRINDALADLVKRNSR